MTSETFWNLSFYEWSMWILRIRHIQMQRDEQKIFWGNWMAFYGNYKQQEGSDLLTREDFYPLSIDERREEKKKLTPEELQAQLEKNSRRG